MIVIEKVNKYFNRHRKNQIHVIDNTSLKLGDTGLVALLGPSGSGKTTLLNVIGGLDKVSKGKIYINNQRITRRSVGKIDKIRNLNVGYIFQDYKLVDNMSVFDNIALVLKMVGIRDKKEIKTRVNYVLETLGIYRYRNRPAAMLSGGERQRVGIARAIVKEPNIIIADEPTGNLDSKNTLEIMNIIKAISKTRLVILVTHEVNLAKFYASRIIELEDGKILKDYKNNHDGELDYAIENNIYLKDFKNYNKINKETVAIDYYSDSGEKVDLDIVVKNGNIYIKSNTNEKIEIIDQNSNIELIDDHYKKIDKSVYQKYEFNFSEVINKNIKLKYRAILNLFTLIIGGFKKVFDYSFLKKLLLLGFFAASMFILMALSQIFAILNVEDKNFVKYNKEYLQVMAKKISVTDYLNYEKMDHINYILPGDSIVNFTVKYDDYYQTIEAMDNLSGSLSSIKMISASDLTYGRMPEHANELVIDEMALATLLNVYNGANALQSGILTTEGFLGREITKPNMKSFTIVGITNNNSPSIYADESLFINLISNNESAMNDGVTYQQSYTTTKIDEPTYDGIDHLDYNLKKGIVKLKKGKWPLNDYEVVVNYENRDSMPLNKTIDNKINNKKLKVVGYYTVAEEAANYYLVSPNTLKYKMITNKENITIYSKDDALTVDEFRNLNMNITGTYEIAKRDYVNSNQDRVNGVLIVSGIIILISLIEIFLMIRSSFLSRVKEVGIYRAIGVKKSDIYRMFLGEIIAITSIACVAGIALMSYIIYVLTKVETLRASLMINPLIIALALLICYAFNIIIGVIPVFTTLRKTPAQILARHDIE